jgi:trehalose-6-phosphatase
VHARTHARAAACLWHWQVDWHKGTALSHLVEALGLKDQPDVVAIYVGDDHTDEDAFKTLEETQQGGSWAGQGRAARACVCARAAGMFPP